MKAAFQSYLFSNCETVFNRSFILGLHLTTCTERVKNFIRGTCIKLRNLCLTSWTLLEFNTLISRDFPKTWLDSNLNPFACKTKASKTTTQPNGLESIFPSRFPTLQILWKNQFSSTTLILTISLFFISALKFLATRNQAKMKNLFFNIETTINFKLRCMVDRLTHRHNQKEQASLNDWQKN